VSDEVPQLWEKSKLNYILKQVLNHLWPQQDLKHNSAGVKGMIEKATISLATTCRIVR
jgi:hypothetical protein